MSLPRWMEPLPDAEQQREIDRWAIEERGVPSLELMERAGAGLAAVVARHAPVGPVVVVCGKGNNGGDGFVAARVLREAGRDVEVLQLWRPEKLTPDAAEMLRRLPGDPPVDFEPSRLERASVIVDALLGTGFSGVPRDPLGAVIRAINDAPGVVVAADVPSGVDASSGEVAGDAVRAVATATFHRAKPGLWIHPGKAHAGAVHAIDIGIPDGAPGDVRTALIGPEVVAEMPRREATSTKFSSGAVTVIGGSPGLTGAPIMAAAAAMRAGAGYVSIATARSLEPSFALRPVESMLTLLPDAGGELEADAVDAALRAIRRAGAVVLGPGLGRGDAAVAFVRALYERVDVPLVLDADGLNALEGAFGDLAPRRWPTVLTPHAGELGRLLGVPSEEIGRRRLEHVRAAAAQARAFVVLKGDDTLVAAPAGRVAVSPGGAPALATAGTGDVLAGVVAALLARGMPPAAAASAAVWAHVRAGRIAAEPHGPDGVAASDVIAALPAALSTRDGIG
ncbi:MAG TPA: NAD(P)H-hydrate dehydratase [Solirubrobacteraceae bacterium]|nr:NAD(P)H-hydrate dehydratase [Solirubrobacteraceae bacterium]